MSVEVITIPGGSGPVTAPVPGSSTTPVVTPAVRVPKVDDLADVSAPAGSVPQETDLVWRQGADGIYRLTPMPQPEPQWGDDVRFAAGAPTDDDAPAGVFHVDYTTGQLYEKET